MSTQFTQICVRAVQEISFFLFLIVCTSILFSSTGFTDPIGLVLIGIVGFSVTSALRNLVWRRLILRKNIQSQKWIFYEFIIFILLFQSILVFIVPLSSIVPGKLLEAVHVITYIEGNQCESDTYFESAHEFWGDSIDFEQVHLIAGGAMHVVGILIDRGILDGDTTHFRAGMTFGDTIYIPAATVCPSRYTFFHEMTHVWQMQTQQDSLWGITTIPHWISYVYTQFTNPNMLYDYGGGDGLMRAYAEGKSFFEFGIEQQAMIIEDLIWLRDGYVLPEGEGYTDAYRAILEKYVGEMLQRE